MVITSVDRDDLPNGGAEAFAGCITEIRARLPETSVEVLIPDFQGLGAGPRDRRWTARPDILNHNLETAERLYRLARPGGRYDRALRLLANARRHGRPGALTKSGIILGMGEEWDEVLDVHARPAPERREHPHAGPVPAARPTGTFRSRGTTRPTNSPNCGRSACQWDSRTCRRARSPARRYHAWEQVEQGAGPAAGGSA